MPKKLPPDSDLPEAEADAPGPPLPKRVKLLRPHGFIDHHGQHQYWTAGQVVKNADEIQTLLARGAMVEALD
jgi:hypothetical protein